MPTTPPWGELMESFPALALPGVGHGFVKRIPEVAGDLDKAAALSALWPWHQGAVAALGFDPAQAFHAEQIHGSAVAAVTGDSPRWIAGADGLMTNQPGLMLGIHVADCAPVYLVDRRRRAIALLHSGRKGSEAGITRRALRQMAECYGSAAADVVVQLGPCIRPPLFEVDLAALIRRDALEAGVPPEQIHDCGSCTGAGVAQYYSYRLERGRTGRLLALLGLRA